MPTFACCSAVGHDLLLLLDVVARDLDPLLGHPELHVIRRHVGQERHQGVVVVFDRSVEAAVGGLDGPAVAAPEIQFPAQVEAGGQVGVEVADGEAGRDRVGRCRLRKGRGVVEGIVAEGDAAVGARRFLGLGEEVAGRDRLLRRAWRTRIPTARRFGFCW